MYYIYVGALQQGVGWGDMSPPLKNVGGSPMNWYPQLLPQNLF